VVGKLNSSILHVPEDVQSGLHLKIVQEALRDGKWEGTLLRLRKNSERFTARVVITPRYDYNGNLVACDESVPGWSNHLQPGGS